MTKLITTILFLSVVVLGVHFVFMMSLGDLKLTDSVLTDKTNTPKTNSYGLEKKEDSIPNDWKIFTDSDIGIEFRYPGIWGTVISVSSKGCDLDERYYGKKGVDEIVTEMTSSPNDKCDEVRIGPSLSSVLEFPIPMLATMSPLYAKYPVPKGGSWMWRAKDAANLQFIKELCTKSLELECKTYTNSQGVLVTNSYCFYGE